MICILTSNAVVYTVGANAIYVEDDELLVDTPTGVMHIRNIPGDALQQIAMAEAEGKRFVEFEDAVLLVGDAE